MRFGSNTYDYSQVIKAVIKGKGGLAFGFPVLTINTFSSMASFHSKVDLDIVKPCIKEILIIVTHCQVSTSGPYDPLVFIFFV